MGAKGPGGILALAAAVKCSRAASAAARDLAAQVMIEAAEDLADDPREFETTVACFHRQMDVLIDATNASHAMPTRMARRVHLARAMERGGVVLVDVAHLAKLVEARIQRIERACNMAATVPCAADMEACGGEHHAPFEGVATEALDRLADFIETGQGSPFIGDFIGDVGRNPLSNSNVND